MLELTLRLADDETPYIERYEAYEFSGEHGSISDGVRSTSAVAGDIGALGSEDDGKRGRISDAMRFPHAVAGDIRALGSRDGDRLVDYLQPQLNPTDFAAQLEERLSNGHPIGKLFGKRAKNIANYCAVRSSARAFAHRTASEKTSASSGVNFGYIEYSPTLAGMYLGPSDPDDHELNEPEQEIQVARAIDAEEAERNDEHIDESGTPILLSTHASASRQGVAPGDMARARASIVRLEIDRESLPWSASHLRPAEIEPTLLKTLKELASESPRHSQNSIEEYEIATLVAVCLETGRPLERVLNLNCGEDPKGEFSLLHRPRISTALRWWWQGLQPDYKLQQPFIDDKEERRSSYVVNPIYKTTESLLINLIIARSDKASTLFTDSEPSYRKKIRQWLQRLDSSGRLSIAKLCKMQWSLVLQLTGYDYATAGMVLGLPHPRGRVPLFYSIMSLATAKELFAASTRMLWGEEVTK
jgi:hypothetical protein